jgi:hypothetical protein
MTTIIHNYQKDEDDVALAEIVLLKIADEQVTIILIALYGCISYL